MSHSSIPIMTLVIRVERGAPPTRTDALEAAAVASISTWLATETSEGTSGADVIAKWKEGPRKIVRRARGSVWREACELADATATVGSAEVLGFKVGEAGATPDLLRGLQVSGLELDDVEVPPEPADEHPVIWLNPHLAMTTGKAMAQAGHGAMMAWEDASEPARTEWLASGLRLSVRTASISSWPDLEGRHPLVTDGGYTEVSPGSRTAAVALPGWVELERRQGAHDLLLR